MTRARTLDLLRHADAEERGLAAFNVLHLETVEALAEAATRAGNGIVLQISENCVDYHGSLAPIAEATKTVAAASDVLLAVHLDHATRTDLIREAIDLGFDSVMYDGAALPYDANVATTSRMAELVHAAGAAIEAELGEVGGKDGAHAPGVRTDPAEARAFVEATGGDALAVAVGSSHQMVDRTAQLDLDLVERLRVAVPVPLVLHGSSGVPDTGIRLGIAAGLRKINVSTQLNKAFTSGVRARLERDGALVDSRKYLHEGRELLTAEADRLIRLFARPLGSPDAT